MNYFDVLLARKLEDKRDPQIVGLSVTENGTYSEEGKVYKPVVVNVPEKTLTTKSITANGTYNASADNADGYSSVNVNVPLPTNAYLLKSVANLPQAIASFNDGEEMVMPSLKVAIEPQQEGSGDPSPTNVRPISGWDEANVSVSGKNLAENVLVGGSIGGTGVIGTASGYSMAYGKVKKGVTYTITTNDSQLVGGFFENEPQIGAQSYNGSRNIQASKTFTAPINGYIAFRILEGYTQYQLEIGSTATTYEPYNGQTYTIDLDGTRYGGEVDVVNGIVTPAPYYASYNGETLTGEWISDRDKYEVGATPTIGAQVVNIGASGTPVSILPTAVKSLRGVNNVWADTGDIKDAEYFSKETE